MPFERMAPQTGSEHRRNVLCKQVINGVEENAELSPHVGSWAIASEGPRIRIVGILVRAFFRKKLCCLVRNGCNLFVMGNGLRNLRQMGLDVMEKCVAIVSKESKGMHFNRVTTLEAGALSWTPQQLFRSVITTPLILTDANSLLVLCYNLCCRVYRLHLDVVWTSAKYYMSLRWKVDIMKNAQVFVGEPDGKNRKVYIWANFMRTSTTEKGRPEALIPLCARWHATLDHLHSLRTF